MKGKEKCKALKEIRQKIAEQNDIAFAVSECTHQGDCRGTCPKCEAELRYLERQLEIRKNLGKAVVVAGISAGMCAPMVACNPIEAVGDVIADVYYTINSSNKDAKNGEWKKGPGMKLFSEILKRFNKERIIAEDLGTYGEDVVCLLETSEIKGMRVVQFV